MSFDWSEYLTLAQELTSASTSSPIQEAHLRAAISRAYYAAFCKARNYLLNKDGYVTPRNTNAHQDIITKFEGSGDMGCPVPDIMDKCIREKTLPRKVSERDDNQEATTVYSRIQGESGARELAT